MPIEIKELHIRVAVNMPSSHGDKVSVGRDSNRDDHEDKKGAQLTDCVVEQVLEILQNKMER